MDVGYFISELLGKHGKIGVPGLGYFAHSRVNGYYNEAEGKFYPPTHSVSFTEQAVDDDTLSEYIAERKNISLASSKYFTEKFINNIKLQAANGEIKLADMGWFYTEGSTLAFRPNNGISTDPEFFGFPALTMFKLGQQQSAPQITEVATVEEEAPQQPILSEDGTMEFASEEEHEAYIIDYTSKRRRKVIWTFVTLAAISVAAILFFIYKVDPSNLGLNQLVEKEKPEEAPKPLTHKAPAKRDTIIQVNADTLYNTMSDVSETKTNDTIPFPRYEVLGGAFKDKAAAQIAVAGFEKRGIKASIAQFVPGPRVHITLGTYKTQAEAEKARAELKKNKKLKEEIYTQKSTENYDAITAGYRYSC